MHRLTRLSAIAIAALTLVVGATQAQETYADPHGRFVTPVPPGWSTEATPDVVTFRRSDPDGVLHVLAPVGEEQRVLTSAMAILVDPPLDPAFVASPLQVTPAALPSGVWTQRIYLVGDEILAALTLERGAYTVLVLAKATQAAFVQAVNDAVNRVVAGLEVLIPEPVADDPADLPYLVEEVAFASGDVTLAGVLSLPPTPGPHPAVALVSGSGAQDRDGANPSLPGYLPLRWLADHLARSGFAVLRWDERGVGESTGDHEEADTADLADDLEAGVTFLSTRSEIDPERVGILGHSEGGIIVALVAARTTDVAFVVSMAGPAVSYAEGVVKQVERILETGGAGPEAVAEAVAQQERVVALALAEDWDALTAFLTAIAAAQAEALPEATRAQLGDLDAFVANQVAGQVAAFQSPWMRWFLSHDPAVDWARVTVPVLALFGGLDVQVDVEQNRAPLEAALAAAGNDDVTIVVFDDANHLFQRAVTGGPEEYLRLEMAFAPGFLQEISAWLAERFLP